MSELRVNRIQSQSGLPIETPTGIGFTPAGVGAVATTVQSKLREFVSVKDFGAVGDGIADDTAAIQAALNSGAYLVLLPLGTYKTTSTIYIPDRVTFRGQGTSSIINASAVSGAAIKSYFGPFSTFKIEQRLEDLKITGTSTYGVIWSGSTTGGMKNVWVAGTHTHGFIVDGSFGCLFEQLKTYGAQISGACFWAGADFNANHLNGLYTSTFSSVNFLSSSDANAITGYTNRFPNGHGSTLTNVCCQGGVVGMALDSVNFGGWTINAPYFENCVTPIRLGNGTSLCRSVTINSPFMLAPAFSGHPGGTSVCAIDIDNAVNVVINNPEMGDWGGTTDYIQYRLSHSVLINGFYSATVGIGGVMSGKIKYKAGADSDGGVMLIGEEFNAGPTGSRNHFLMMKTHGFSYQYYKMTLTAAGAWSAASFVPSAAS